jgi:transcriptional regulator with XRE-family HTH domain
MPELQVAGVVPGWTVSDRLRKAREHAGLEQAELAADLGVSRNTVVNYERGRVEPRRPVLVAWALRTGVPLVWLVTGDASSPRQDGPDGGSHSVRPKGLEPPTF